VARPSHDTGYPPGAAGQAETPVVAVAKNAVFMVFIAARHLRNRRYSSASRRGRCHKLEMPDWREFAGD